MTDEELDRAFAQHAVEKYDSEESDRKLLECPLWLVNEIARRCFQYGSQSIKTYIFNGNRHVIRFPQDVSFPDAKRIWTERHGKTYQADLEQHIALHIMETDPGNEIVFGGSGSAGGKIYMDDLPF